MDVTSEKGSLLSGGVSTWLHYSETNKKRQ